MNVVARRQRADTSRLDVARQLLDWYGATRRELPWRMAPGVAADPYAVWLSEIMLQQTTVKAVIPYFDSFMARWPTVAALAAAAEDDVLAAWAGLGYYARARNLMACAKIVAKRPGGRFPAREAELLELPGIGPYTAAAIAAIAFGQSASPVDGNIERVVARLFAVEAPLPGAKPELRRLSASLTPKTRAGDFAQAMMDLGATICTPRNPSCGVCPVTDSCAARARRIAARLPARTAKPERPVRHGAAFVALREDGCVLLRRRPGTGLLARMLEPPSTAWTERAWTAGRGSRGNAGPSSLNLRDAPLQADWRLMTGTVVHTFTHFRLELAVYRADVPLDSPLAPAADAARCLWLARGKLGGAALPSVMRKVLARGLED